MKKITLLLSVLAILFVAAACSKEKRVENRLEGNWTIAKQTYTNGWFFENSWQSNAGTMSFDKSGNVVWVQNHSGGPTETFAGTYTNSSDVVTMTFNSEVMEFKILKQTRKEMRLRLYTTYVDDEGNEMATEVTFEMDKD